MSRSPLGVAQSGPATRYKSRVAVAKDRVGKGVDLRAVPSVRLGAEGTSFVLCDFWMAETASGSARFE